MKLYSYSDLSLWPFACHYEKIEIGIIMILEN